MLGDGNIFYKAFLTQKKRILRWEILLISSNEYSIARAGDVWNELTEYVFVMLVLVYKVYFSKFIQPIKIIA